GIGKYTSNGVELETTGEIAHNLNIITGYTFNKLDIVINRDAMGQPKQQGLSFNSRNPRHLFKLWLEHRLDSGVLSGLLVGGGVTAQSATATGVTGSVLRQPGYGLVNLRLGYEASKRWSLSLNVNNLLDKTYYVSLQSPSGYNIYGPPTEWV